MFCEKDCEHSFINNMPIGFACYEIVLDSEGNPVDYIFIEVNRVFEKLIGLGKGDIIGKKFTEVQSEITCSDFDWLEKLGQVALMGGKIQFEQLFKTAGRWYEVTAYSNNYGNLAIIVYDITRYKRADKLMAEREGRYRTSIENQLEELCKKTKEEFKESREYILAILKAVPDIIIKCSREGVYLDIITLSEDKLYQTVQDLRGKKLSEVLPEDVAGSVMDTIKKAFVRNELQVVEYSLDVPAGRCWFEARVVPIGDEEAIALIRDMTERKLAEKVLQESKQRLSDMINFLPNATIAIDLEGKVIAWNKAVEKMTGVKAEDILGKCDYAYALPFYGKARPILADLILEEHENIEKLFSFIERDGEILYSEGFMPLLYGGKGAYLRGKASTLLDTNDNIVGAIESFHDITGQKLAENALRESEARLRQFIQNFQGIAYQVIYPTWKPTFFYGKVEEFTGYMADDFISGRISWEQLVNPGDLSLVIGEREKLVNMPEYVGDIEYRITHKDGSVRWLRDIGHWINRGSEVFRVIQGVIYDNTQRKQAEIKLQESEARWQFALEGSGDGVWDWNAQTNVVFYSPQWKAMLGYADHEIGNTVDEWHSRVHPEDKKCCHENLQRHFRGEVKVYQNEHRVFCKDGTYKWILDRGKVIEWAADGKPLRVIGTHSDITERKCYEEQLKYMSLHDQLTGLYNRVFFEEEMRRLNSSREYPITIVSVDIDDLKLFNDTQGHNRGDKLLKACAAVLKQSLRKSDILARIGGDEFVAILPRTDAKTGEEIVDRMLSHATLYSSKHAGLPLSISIGTATAETGEVALEEVYKRSDDIMYSKKFQRSAGTRRQIVDTLLVALAGRDYIDKDRVQRLSALCLALGVQLGFSSRQLDDLALLAQVHNLGKVGIPDSILFKKGPLSEEEWEIMRQHPEKGCRIAISSADLSGVINLILKHHERWDGSGYPLRLKGEEIPVECRVLAIADAYDAMINDRPYRKARSKEEAINELKRYSGTQFDPELVDIFLSLLD
jgi:diguanylate cyclase (GGDEF)-like protein/PAS domain S-box-containing protein